MIISFVIAVLALQAPTIVGQGSLSTDQVETSIAMTPDEQVAFVSRHNGSWGSRDNPPTKIYEYRLVNNEWESRGFSPFSSESTSDSDSDIFISYDGQETYFVSTRPYSGKIDDNRDIWRSRMTAEGWSAPSPVSTVNRDGYESSPVTDAAGNLYFSSVRAGGLGLGDLYIANRNEDGSFAEPKLLAGEINGPSGEWNLTVSPEANWIIFESSGRAEGLSSYGDLYLSEITPNGWSSPTHLRFLNSTGSDLNPRLLVNSQKLLFVSSLRLESATTDFYVVDMKEIESYMTLDR